MVNIILLGPPGSGKGTISHKLEKEFNYLHISTGDIFREEIALKSPLGLQIEEIVKSGKYVPDEITNLIVKNKILSLEQEQKHFILDGYPRTVNQANFIDQISKKNFLVINLKLSNNDIIKRLSQRYFCSKCKKTYNLDKLKSKKHPFCESDDTLLIVRDDDSPSSVEKRLKVYEEENKQLITFYKNKENKCFYEINASKDVEEILGEIKGIILENGTY